MLLSGTDGHVAGVGAMAEHFQEFHYGKPGYEGYLNDRVAALLEALSQEGCYAVMSGKWHLGLTPDRFPAKRGFERSFTHLPWAANHYNFEPQIKSDLERTTPPLYAEDDQVVDSTGQLDNTFVVFISDHGAEGALLEAKSLFGSNL